MPTDAHGFFVLFLEIRFRTSRKKFVGFFLLSLNDTPFSALIQRIVVQLYVCLWFFWAPCPDGIAVCVCMCACMCVWVQLKHAYAWIRIYQKDFNNRCRIKENTCTNCVRESVYVRRVRVCECKLTVVFSVWFWFKASEPSASVWLKPVSSDSF